MGREWMWANPDAGLIPVYTAPPSPLAPDLKELEEILDWILMLPCPTPKATHFAKRLAVVIDTCRAAMLQGAENAESRCTIQAAPALDSLPKNAESRCSNSPVIPDGWVACSERMPEPEVDVQIYCSDKKEQMVGYLERNEREGCFRFATWRNGDGIYCQPTHWMPLPAAPQQEVK
ncbi:DUF551 domain-containing protein [Enterobacter asburiae]|nr:DUF551 domain-containing protein [Enterobacter asburiae]